MKAVIQTEFGGVNVFKIAEVPKPQPKDRDLLVRVHAVATNPVDYKKRVNYGNLKETVPVTEGWNAAGTTSAVLHNSLSHVVPHLILGWDASGVVEAIGKDVTKFHVGDHVFFAGSISRTGSNAEYCVVDERIVGRKPSNLTHEEAAAIPLTGLTAWEGLVDHIGFKVPTTPEQVEANSKKSVLIIGGAGGVGSIAIQIASRVLKLQVIATASRPETIEYCKKMGAHHVINHRENLVSQFEQLPIKEVNGIFNTSDFDPELFDQWTKILKPMGRIASIVLCGKPLNLVPLFVKAGTLSWVLMFTRPLFESEDIERQHEILNALSEQLEQRVLESHKNVEYPHMKHLGAAHELQATGTAIGKIVLSAKFD